MWLSVRVNESCLTAVRQLCVTIYSASTVFEQLLSQLDAHAVQSVQDLLHCAVDVVIVQRSFF